MRWALVLLDGVTYLAGHREPVVLRVEVDAGRAPGAEAAGEALRAALASLEGPDARLRAGFASVRLHEGGAWLGPAHLFSFEAREVGAFETTYAGEDPGGDDGGPPPGD